MDSCDDGRTGGSGSERGREEASSDDGREREGELASKGRSIGGSAGALDRFFAVHGENGC